MSRLKIAVLFGGCSPEYGVSLQSAAAVLRHMAQSRYEPVMVGISQAGDWFHYTGPVDSIESDSWHNAETCVPAVMRPDRSAPALLVFGRDGFLIPSMVVITALLLTIRKPLERAAKNDDR